MNAKRIHENIPVQNENLITISIPDLLASLETNTRGRSSSFTNTSSINGSKTSSWYDFIWHSLTGKTWESYKSDRSLYAFESSFSNDEFDINEDHSLSFREIILSDVLVIDDTEEDKLSELDGYTSVDKSTRSMTENNVNEQDIQFSTLIKKLLLENLIGILEK